MIQTQRNSIQVSLMRLFDKKMSETELKEIHLLLMNYYDQLIGDEAEQIMKEKGYSQADLDAILNQQQRTKI
jgi:hypothetical protein